MGRKINMLKYVLFNPYKKRLWEIKKKPPTVLLATYVHKYKDYSFNAWTDRAIEIINHYKQFVGKLVKIDLLVVDNSEGKDYFNELMNRLSERIDDIGFGSEIWVEHVDGKNTRDKQWKSQKLIWDFSLKHHYDYLFIIESDIFPPKNALIELLKYDKKVISGVYSLKNEETYLAHRKVLEKSGEIEKWRDEDIGDLLCIIPYFPRKPIHRKEFEAMIRRIEKKQFGHCVRVFACGLGVILIRRDVLRVVPPETTNRKLLNWLEFVRKISVKEAVLRGLGGNEKQLIGFIDRLIKSHRVILESKIHPDTNFHINCELNGISRFVNPYLECFHWRSNWGNIPIER